MEKGLSYGNFRHIYIIILFHVSKYKVFQFPRKTFSNKCNYTLFIERCRKPGTFSSYRYAKSSSIYIPI